jgi:hypothetical protein
LEHFTLPRNKAPSRPALERATFILCSNSLFSNGTDPYWALEQIYLDKEQGPFLPWNTFLLALEQETFIPCSSSLFSDGTDPHWSLEQIYLAKEQGPFPPWNTISLA